jgi:glycyl-tRNA synthetase alpha subunit
MAEPVQMPRQGLSVETCILSAWEKNVGDKVEKGDILFSYETDKSTFELESEVEGVLLEKFFKAGDEVSFSKYSDLLKLPKTEFLIFAICLISLFLNFLNLIRKKWVMYYINFCLESPKLNYV